MYSFNSRAVRGIMTGLLLALAACSDEPTEPIRDSGLAPSFGVGDVLTVTNTSGGTGIGSLRWVLSQIQGGEVIRFDPSLAGQTIALDTTLVITGKPVTIEGPANGGITISGGGKMRVMHLDPGLQTDSIVLRNLTIANGSAPATSGAAGILQSGYFSAKIIIENSTLTGHVAGTDAVMNGLTVVMRNSTASGNTNLNSTSNSPTVFARKLTLINSTIAHNTGGGVGTEVVMRNSIVTDNTKDNCTSGPIVVTHEGGNISDDGTCGTVFDLTIGDPVLGPLADNGGPTMTHALLVGSPAINNGSSCSVAMDQRYAPRDSVCDIGAYEFIDFTTVNLAVASTVSADKNGWAVLNGSVQCSRNETFELHVTVQQYQRTVRDSVDVHAVAVAPITCTTTPLPYSVALVSTDGPFQSGDATATVMTMNARKWVTPASVTQPVRVVRIRK